MRFRDGQNSGRLIYFVEPGARLLRTDELYVVDASNGSHCSTIDTEAGRESGVKGSNQFNQYVGQGADVSAILESPLAPQRFVVFSENDVGARRFAVSATDGSVCALTGRCYMTVSVVAPSLTRFIQKLLT